MGNAKSISLADTWLQKLKENGHCLTRQRPRPIEKKIDIAIAFYGDKYREMVKKAMPFNFDTKTSTYLKILVLLENQRF